MAEINAVVADIAAGAQEQSTGLQQVNTAVNQMDQVTQQNAAMVEETTAAAHGLASESEELGQMVGRYQVGKSKDDPLRAELKKAAPHAFRQPAKTDAPATSARAKPKAPRQRPDEAVANAAPPRAAASGGAAGGWEEF